MAQESILLDELNERELEIISLLAEGLANKEIANRLFLAPNTVKWYVRQLNSKLDTSNRNEIVARANELGLLDAEQPPPPKHNLPYATTPFVGREAELDEVKGLLTNPDLRLLTLTGPGGSG
jgi:DNA-binding CsgD family transcriptional regulator